MSGSHSRLNQQNAAKEAKGAEAVRGATREAQEKCDGGDRSSFKPSDFHAKSPVFHAKLGA